MTDVALLQAALGLPIVAALAWLGLARWPWARRPVAGVTALAANVAAWNVFWAAYQGRRFVWRTFEPELLGATIVAVAELGFLIVALRAERLREGGNATAIFGLTVGATALAALAYTTSVAVVALALALPTLSAAAAAVSGRGRQDARGLIGLAAADAIAALGLSLVYARAGTVTLAEVGGVGPPLLLVSALLKAGTLPGLATWRLAATEGPGGWLDVVLRAQAVALASLAALTLRSSAALPTLAAVAAIAVLLGAVVAWAAGGRGARLAAVLGSASALPFVALGLGGPVGTRAFLLLFPVLLLGVPVVALLARIDPAEDEELAGEPVGWGGWLGAAALGVAVASLLGIPPGGGFPGAWLTVSLATARAEQALPWLLAAGATAVGVALAMAAVAPLIRGARVRAAPAIVGALASLALVYVGTQPIRLGLGWWIRVETALGLPEVLPTAGAPGLPAIGGSRLLLALAPAAVLALAVVALGRGVRDVAPAPLPDDRLIPPRIAERLRTLSAPVAPALRAAGGLVEQARARGLGFGIAAVLELATVLMVGRIVMLAARAGFL